jgi:uncharacterized protein (DUF983 family)
VSPIRSEILRALRLRCPFCGRKKMFYMWVKSFERCANCGLLFDRGEPDYYIGAYTINLIVAELIVVAAMLVVIFATWPEVPWEVMPWGLAVLAILGPLVTYPFSKSLWLGLDLLFRPAEPKDFLSSSPARGARP